MKTRDLIVFSDLDGTLLDHETYSYEPALPALAKLKECNVPLILASSKTPAEMVPLRAELGFADCPAIVENGAGVLASNANAIDAGENYEKLIACLNDLPHNMRSLFVGFSDMSIDRIAADTGLSLEGTARAKLRSFSEPGHWNGNDEELDRFKTLLSEHGIQTKQGGRFLTLSFGGDKAQRMVEIIEQVHADLGKKPISIALGDAPNDLGMLRTADHGVIIANDAHQGISTLPEADTGQITRSTKIGPSGWNEAVLAFLTAQST